LASRGVVVRTGDWIERMAAVDTVVFDKTGTLSEERLQVVDMAVVPGTDRAALLAWMVAVERRSQHPVAKAMAGWGRHVQDDPAWQVGPVETLPGVGVSARLAAGDRVHTLELGNAGLLSEMDAAVLTSLEAERRAGTEYTHKLFVRLDGRLVAMTWLRESFRESAASVREALLARGLKVVVMTGDRPEHAAQLGWDGIEAGLTPEAKASRVAELEQAGHRVLFVGDGINDSAAMSRAHASLAMSEGADLARESAHAVLLGGDLAEVARAIDRCRTTVRTIRGNIRFAFIYNFVGIALAASGVLHPVAAAFLMLASSLTVTWRSLRPVKVGPVPVPVRKKIGPVQAGIAVVCGVALGLHGPMLGWMGGWGFGTTLVFGLATLVAGVWLTANWSRRDPGPVATVYAGMLTVGTLGMLIGWLIDAGWGPVVRDGVCLCGCPKSQLGQGLFARWNWMTGGMLLASVPFLFIAFPRAWWRRVRGVCAWAGHAVFCLGGMWMGMEAAAGVMAFFPIVHPKGQFLLTFFAMMFGMCMGMLAACSVFTRLFKEQWKILNPKPNAAV
jgi:soluble P-type ATPase